MPLYEVTEEGLERRPPAAFAALGMYERADLKRLLRDDISALDEDLSPRSSAAPAHRPPRTRQGRPRR